MGHSRAGPADATSSAAKNEMELAAWLDIEPTMTDALSSVPSRARLARSTLDSERARRPRYFWYVWPAPSGEPTRDSIQKIKT